VLEAGQQCEKGTLAELMAAGGAFSALVRDHTATANSEDTAEAAGEAGEEAKPAADTAKSGGSTALMTTEERAKGAVSGRTWATYMVPLFVAFLFC
jgi:hypothetical protein